MNSGASLDKIEYMMNKIGGDDELSVDDLETMIIKVFVSSFEQEHGFEAALVRELLSARHTLMTEELDEELDSDEAKVLLVPPEEVESQYIKFQAEMYVSAGYDKSYAEESASWPDALPLNGDWDKKFLRHMARKEVAHHLVVLDQIRAEMESMKNAKPDS